MAQKKAGRTHQLKKRNRKFGSPPKLGERLQRIDRIRDQLTKGKLLDLRKFAELAGSRNPQDIIMMEIKGTKIKIVQYRDEDGLKLHIRRDPDGREDPAELALAAWQKVNEFAAGGAQEPVTVTFTLKPGDDQDAIRAQVSELLGDNARVGFFPTEGQEVVVDQARSPRNATPSEPSVLRRKDRSSQIRDQRIRVVARSRKKADSPQSIASPIPFSDRSGLRRIIKTDAFVANTRRKGLLSRQNDRTEAYDTLVRSLEKYEDSNDRLIAEFETDAKAINERLHIQGAQKREAFEASMNIRKQIDGQQKLIETTGQYLATRKGHLKEIAEGNSKQDQQTVERDIQELSTNIRAAEAQMATLQNQLRVAEDTLAKFDAEIEGLIRESERLLDDALKTMAANSQFVQEAAKNYLREKQQGKSSNTDKIREVEELIRQLDNSGGELLDVLASLQKASSYAHLPARGLHLLNSGTANVVFRVQTRGEIGNSSTNMGFAKRAMAVGEIGNDTTEFLNLAPVGEPLQVPPNLIARQVISSRLDQALQFNVLATEVFSVDEAGGLIGISANAGDTFVKVMEDRDGTTFHRVIKFHDSEIQRNLANLQLLDAITGQRDRHLGNLFIDPGSKRIVGIDNDMAFVAGKDLNQKEHFDNPATNELYHQFSRGPDGVLTFLPNLIDKQAGEAVLAMNVEQFRALLAGAEHDPEKLSKASIDAAVERFTAVQTKIKELRKEKALIGEWDGSTFERALRVGTIQTKDPNNPNYSNYLARAEQSLRIADSGRDAKKKVSR